MLAQRLELLEHIGALTRIALDGVELAPMLDRIAHYLHERFKAALVEITLCNPGDQELLILAQIGKSVLGLGIGDVFPVGKGLTAEVISTGKAVYAPDVRVAMGFLRSSPKSLSNLVLPLNFRGRVLGVINLESDKLDGFKLETRVLLTSLADQLAGAVYWAQLNQMLAEKTRELEIQRAELEIQRAELAHANRKLKLANAKLEKSALSDPLTSLANRRAWDNHVKREFARAQRSQRNFSVAIIDADNFKAFNDRFGHAAGDRTLKRISAVLTKYTRRSGELAARVGGEEFGLLLPEIAAVDAQVVCERLLAEVAELKGCTTISIGLKSAVPTVRGTVEKFVELADRALYRAKRAGRNRLTIC